MNRVLALIFFSILLLASGCTWVKPTPGGEKVRVMKANEITTCTELATTTVSLMDKIAGIDRDPEKVAKELQTLARNSAAKIGGDTVVPRSEVNAGEQRFGVYRCNGVSQ